MNIFKSLLRPVVLAVVLGAGAGAGFSSSVSAGSAACLDACYASYRSCMSTIGNYTFCKKNLVACNGRC